MWASCEVWNIWFFRPLLSHYRLKQQSLIQRGLSPCAGGSTCPWVSTCTCPLLEEWNVEAVTLSACLGMEMAFWGVFGIPILTSCACLSSHRMSAVGKPDTWEQRAPHPFVVYNGIRQQSWATGEGVYIEENTWKSWLSCKTQTMKCHVKQKQKSAVVWKLSGKRLLCSMHHSWPK